MYIIPYIGEKKLSSKLIARTNYSNLLKDSDDSDINKYLFLPNDKKEIHNPGKSTLPTYLKEQLEGMIHSKIPFTLKNIDILSAYPAFNYTSKFFSLVFPGSQAQERDENFYARNFKISPGTAEKKKILKYKRTRRPFDKNEIYELTKPQYGTDGFSKYSRYQIKDQRNYTKTPDRFDFFYGNKPAFFKG